MLYEMNYQKEKHELMKIINKFFGLEIFNGDSIEVIQEKKKQFDGILNEMKGLGMVLCGGAITSLFSNQHVSDLDFYVKNSSKIGEANAFLNRWFNSSKPFISINAISYRRKSPRSKKIYQAQLITRFTGSCHKIFENFDFTVCMGAFDFELDTFAFGERFHQDLAARRLVYGGASRYPICAMYRTRKYQKKGFTLPGSTVMHIALSIVRLEIKTYKDLKEQLQGIDTLYLQGLLNNKNPEFQDKLPVDYGKFLQEAFTRIDGFASEDEREDDPEWTPDPSYCQGNICIDTTGQGGYEYLRPAEMPSDPNNAEEIERNDNDGVLRGQ